LKNFNTQLKQEVEQLQQISEFNNRELLDLEYKKHQLTLKLNEANTTIV